MKKFTEIDYSALAQRLRFARGAQSQGELAALLGVNQADISRYELARVKPANEYLLRLGSEKRFSVDWLITGQGWSYSTSSQMDALSWVKNIFQERRIKSAVLLAYNGEIINYREDRELIYGWLFSCSEQEPPLLVSLEGATTRLETTSGRALAGDILRLLHQKSVKLYKRTVEGSDQAETLRKDDLNTYFLPALLGDSQVDALSELKYVEAYKKEIVPDEQIKDITSLLSLESNPFKEELLKLLRTRRTDVEDLKNVREQSTIVDRTSEKK